MTLSPAARLNKGKSAERELFSLLNEQLGTSIVRNLQQTQNGGCDSLADDFPFAIEVKRQETLNLREWWSQTTRQATHVGKVPLLAYRPSRKPWKFVLPAAYLTTTGNDYLSRPLTLEWSAELHLDAFCELVRERI